MKTQIKNLLCCLTLAALLLGWGHWRFGSGVLGGVAGGGSQAGPPGCPTNLDQLLASAPSQISRRDIAVVNLICAEGLPGAENLNRQQCLATLDRWAERVRTETARHLYRYRANPREFESSEGYFRMLIMAVVLYEDFSVRYNPERITTTAPAQSDDHFFANSRDLFLHGLLSSTLNPQLSTLNRPLGTCSSMPVLYVAIGRRLGYPLKLATTKSHVFLRWEGNVERFDMETTGKGMNRFDDEHFKQWPFPVTHEEIAADGYLKSLSPAEELALFLSLRGHCLEAAGRMPEAAASYGAAVRLAPASRPYRLLLAAATLTVDGRDVPRRTLEAIPQARVPIGSVPHLSPVPGPTPDQPPDPNPLLKLSQR